jgi:hypothetical protein
MTEIEQGARNGMNETRTCTKSGAESAHDVRGLFYRLDCSLRNERDATKRMQLALRMGMEREGSTPAFKARQDGILRGSNRIRAKAGREVLA